MREQEEHQSGESSSEQAGIESTASELPIVMSARTGLAGKDDAILRRIPIDYSGKTVKEALDYIIGGQLNDTELPLAESIKRELSGRGSVVVINGKTAKLDDKVDKYLIEREHSLPGGSKRKYRELEFEISAVQQGGLYNLLR